MGRVGPQAMTQYALFPDPLFSSSIGSDAVTSSTRAEAKVVGYDAPVEAVESEKRVMRVVKESIDGICEGEKVRRWGLRKRREAE